MACQKTYYVDILDFYNEENFDKWINRHTGILYSEAIKIFKKLKREGYEVRFRDKEEKTL